MLCAVTSAIVRLAATFGLRCGEAEFIQDKANSSRTLTPASLLTFLFTDLLSSCFCLDWKGTALTDFSFFFVALVACSDARKSYLRALF